jgi:hypothetical protein
METSIPDQQPSQHSVQEVQASWNVTAHAQKPHFVFRRNGLVHLNRRGRQFIRLLADEIYASAVVMLDTPCSELVWRVLATHSIRQFPLHFPSRASPCAITFQLDSSRSLSLGLQWLERKANHPSVSITKIKNEWRFTSIPPCTFLTWVRTVLALLPLSRFPQELKYKEFCRTDVSLNAISVTCL